jgi:DNA-directed RNA polymerase subunit F
MSYTLHYKNGPTMAVAEISALAFMETAEPILQEMAAKSREYGTKRLLINLLDVVGTLGPEQQQGLGQLAARYLSHLEKVASLVPPEKITRVSEAAAQAQGMRLRVFVNITEAVAWLME